MYNKYPFFLDNLKQYLKPFSSVVLLFSGGIDSALLLLSIKNISKEKDEVIALTFSSPLQSQRSIAFTKRFTQFYKIKHIIIDYKPLKENAILRNTPNRCYRCKYKMFFIAEQLIFMLSKPVALCDGSNIDDNPLQRPGMRANIKYNILSPWRSLGIGKGLIRKMAYSLGLSIWDTHPDSCLATRFPEGFKLTAENLYQLEVAEDTLKGLGFKDFRIRPFDCPPKIIFSKEDQLRANRLTLPYLWGIIQEKTGWEIK